MAWIILFIAGLFEVGWAIGLAKTEGWTKPIPSIITLVLMVASMWLLGIASQKIPIGTAYPVWTGIGAAGAALLGMLLLNEPRSAARVVFIALIIIGIIGVRATSSPMRSPE